MQTNGDRKVFKQGDLFAMAKEGKFVGTFSARHGAKDDVVDHPQPGIWTLGPIQRQRGRQDFPILYPGRQTMTVGGRHIDDDAVAVVNGRRAKGEVRVVNRRKDKVEIEIAELPDPGLHLVQVLNSNGQFSNDFIFHVAADAEAADALKRGFELDRRDVRQALADAIARNDIEDAKRVIRMAAGQRINEHNPTTGSTPVSYTHLTLPTKA